MPLYERDARRLRPAAATSACATARRRWPSASALFARVAAARAVHRRRVHAAPRRRRAVGPRDDAVHDFVRRGVEARAAGARACCSSFPQVTTVANELGRPDDGTDPIGFFNDEYFVGLKPYDDPAWSGAIRTKAAARSTRSRRSWTRFPGIIFNYTQPAEDAVDEAETGLKSSLAVKIFGSDLETLETKAEAVRKVIAAVPGITGHHARARARAAEPDDRAGPREDRALRPERRRHQHADRDRGRRQRRRRR